jgi:hypothetical protein
MEISDQWKGQALALKVNKVLHVEKSKFQGESPRLAFCPLTAAKMCLFSSRRLMATFWFSMAPCRSQSG